MFKFVFASALALAAVPVLAQDAPTTFNGPYVGIQGGWQQDRQTLRVTDAGVESKGSNKDDGFAYGGQVGYDFRLSPNTVFGVEVALTGRTGTGRLNNGASIADLSQGRTVSATGRLGYLLDPSGLLYVRGGYANGQYKLDNGITKVSEDRDGYTVGAGYERMLAQNVSARLEYNYSDFGKDDLPGVATALGADQAELKYRRHAVTAGLNFRF
ncbi:MAG: outer membrane protein [Polymorphobacter sp.]